MCRWRCISYLLTVSYLSQLLFFHISVSADDFFDDPVSLIAFNYLFQKSNTESYSNGCKDAIDLLGTKFHVITKYHFLTTIQIDFQKEPKKKDFAFQKCSSYFQKLYFANVVHQCVIEYLYLVHD